MSVPYSRLEEDESYYVCGVALFPEHCGQGLGTRFLELAEEKARRRGYRRLRLVVSEQNERDPARDVLGEAELGAVLAHPSDGPLQTVLLEAIGEAADAVTFELT